MFVEVLMLKKSVLLAAVAMTFAAPALATSPVAPGFTNVGTVTRCDDCATGFISTPFALNFFGGTYNGFYISNNGYITFQSGQGTYTPLGLGASYSGQPIVAPFFADVDTRPANGGTVDYGTGTYAGHSAYGVTWNSVGYFSNQTNLLNTFQLLLTDRSDVAAGDFDIYFNYGDINWETGAASGGSGGFGGTPAAAGFNSGTGTFYQLPGSLQTHSFENNGSNPLINQTNDNVAGQYLFGVRSGQIIVGGAVPEPATWAMMLVGFGAIGASMRRSRRSRAAAMATA